MWIRVATCQRARLQHIPANHHALLELITECVLVISGNLQELQVNVLVGNLTYNDTYLVSCDEAESLFALFCFIIDGVAFAKQGDNKNDSIRLFVS